MHYLISLFLIVLVSFDANSNGIASFNDTTVEPVIKDTTIMKSRLKKEKTVSFYFADEYAESNPPFFLTSKDPIKELLISSPTLIIDSYNQIPFLIYPGEQIDVTEGANGLPKLAIAGQKERNNEFDFFVENFKQNKDFDLFMPPNAKFFPDKSFDINEWIQSAKNSLNKREEFLKRFSQSRSISENFIRYSHTLFKFLYIRQILIPVEMPKVDMSSLPASYKAYVDSLKSDFSCDSCLANFGYRIAVGNMKKYILKDFTHSSKKFSLGFDTLAVSFSGLTRRYLLFLQLKENMQKMPAEFENYVNVFLREKNDIYSDYLAENFDFVKKFNSMNDNLKELADIEGVNISWEDLLKKHKGNVLYIDFWASWCVPCRKSMPFSKKLKSEFQNKKMIFIFLSMDKDHVSWKKAVREEGLTSDISYIILDPIESNIVKRFKVNLIPRYMIIDKEGYLVEDEALSPGDPNTQKILNKYL